MESSAVVGTRSVGGSPELNENGFGSVHFNKEIRRLISLRQDNGSSFTALLELPATQAVEFLYSTDPGDSPAVVVSGEGELRPPIKPFAGIIAFPSGAAVTECASGFSVFAGQPKVSGSPPTASLPSNSNTENEEVKNEPMEMDSSLQLISDPRLENQNQNQRQIKRKEQEKKDKRSAKKSKRPTNAKSSGDADNDKLPYVHVRARRGQATDSHSLAERARREKINARMKLLQDLVPGCNKISGTALVLDEIINHVQFLQHQVEFLSMRLAAVNPRIDINLDDILGAEGRSVNDNNLCGTVAPELHTKKESRQQTQHYQLQCHPNAVHHDHHCFIAPGISLLSYDDSGNSATLHPNQVKMEL